MKVAHSPVWLLALLIALSAAVYLPGVSGPFLFDDHPNILQNSYIQIDSLDRQSLHNAAYSVASGPLKRPVAMVSFAVNHYFAGDLSDATPYKFTNIVIHAVNGLLVFAFMRLFLMAAMTTGMSERLGGSGWVAPRLTLLAFGAALLWTVHPMNLTSVLYVVQRMASLSALFSLLALVLYLYGRLALMEGRRLAAGLAWAVLPISLFLGLMSKENAVLVPLFIAVIEWTLFAGQWPWPAVAAWPRARLIGLWSALALVGLAFLLWVLDYAQAEYIYRQFNMLERLLTESRVLFFYAFLILVPRINGFGLHHDDIALSHSLLEPWTTLPALAGWALLLLMAWRWRRRYRLLSFAVLWFLVAHLLESTVLALEIAHEHRNYLASLGMLLAVVVGLNHLAERVKPRAAVFLFAVALLLAGGTTVLRAGQWSEFGRLVYYEAAHHPHSARALVAHGSWLDATGRYAESAEVMRRAIAADPGEASYLINLHMVLLHLGAEPPSEAERQKLRELLARGIPSSATQHALANMSTCLQGSCEGLAADLAEWNAIVADTLEHGPSRAPFLLYRGRALAADDRLIEALNAFQRAKEADPIYLHPMFEMANIFVQLKQTDNAELVAGWIETANLGNPHPRHEELALLRGQIAELRRAAMVGADEAPAESSIP